MIVHSLKYILAAVTAISLLSSCAGSSTPTTPPGFQQNQSHPGKRATSPCPCLYVANFSAPSVTVYAEGATGDATPIQDISGSNTGLRGPRDVAVDASSNIYVSNNGGSVTVYAAGATGNVAPIQDISGSMTGLHDPSGLALNPLNGDIYVATNPYANGGKVTIYPSGSTGNIAPSGRIEGGYTALYGPGELTLGATGKIYVPNSRAGGWSVTVYRAGARGDSAPIQDISGSNTGLYSPQQIALGTHGRIYVANVDGSSVTVYATLANGNDAPIRTIAGSKTQLKPVGIALDGSGHIYVANHPPSTVTVYAANANGNVAPINTISGPNTGLRGPSGIAIR